MSEDLSELVYRAGAQPDGPAPVEAIVGRARQRRLRRRAAFALAPVAALIGGLLVLPGLVGQRVEFSPTGPGGGGSGWPVQVRYEQLDLSYHEVVRDPAVDLTPLDVMEFAGTGWDDWLNVHVATFDMDRAGWSAAPDGGPREGVGEPLALDGAVEAQRYVDGRSAALDVGQHVPADPHSPLATLQAVQDSDVAWGEGVPSPGGAEGPPAPAPRFHPHPTDPAELAGVRMLSEDAWWGAQPLRGQVAAALGLDPDELWVAIYELPFCQDPSEGGEACAERGDAVWIRWVRVHHAATRLPLFVHWAGPGLDAAPDGALQVTQLRVTHIVFGRGD